VSGTPGSSRAGDHGAFDELAVGWALHALEPEDEAVFALHLPDCARCARTVAETSDVMAALATDLPAAEPSPELRERLRAAVERTEQEQHPAAPELPFAAPPGRAVADTWEQRLLQSGTTPSGAERRAPGFPLYDPRRAPGAGDGRPTWRRMAPSALVAAAVAAVLGLGTWAVVLGDDRDRAQSVVAEQTQIMDALLQPGHATIAPVSDTAGHRVATVVARNGQVQVVTSGLGVNNVFTTTYVVWGMRAGSPVALGTFDVVQPQMDLRTVGSEQTGLDDYTAYAISLEPGRQAPTAPSDVVANGQVTS
jgi:Anti-sigma-K factor rskA